MNSSDLNILIRQARRNNKQELNLSGKEIDILPNDIYKIEGLLSLNLSSNKITDIDKSILNLKNLKELDLSNNNITDLPFELITMTNLVTLKLKNNPIKNLIGDISDSNWKAPLKVYLLNKVKSSNNNGSYDNSIGQQQPDFLNTKRNWLEESNTNSGNSLSKTMSNNNNGFGGSNNAITNFSVTGMNFSGGAKMSYMDSQDLEKQISDLENQLQKEKLNNGRLKKEVDRLKANENSGGGLNLSNKSSDFILKSI